MDTGLLTIFGATTAALMIIAIIAFQAGVLDTAVEINVSQTRSIELLADKIERLEDLHGAECK